MALTITEDFRMTAGGRAFRFVTVTSDGATSSLAAVSVDLTYIDHVTRTFSYVASDVADTSVLLHMHQLSLDATHSTLDLGYPPKTGSKMKLMLIGW